MSQAGIINSSGGGSSGVIITTFNISGTWTKNPNSKYVTIQIFGAGGGGGSGDSSDTAISRQGGGGGANLGLIKYSTLASNFSASETVTVGAGGLGGASVTGSAGNNGGPGGDCSVGMISTMGYILNQVSNNPAMPTSGMGGGDDTGGNGGVIYSNISELISFQEADLQWGGNGYYGGPDKDAQNIPPFNSGGVTPFVNETAVLFQYFPVGAGGGGGISSDTVTENGGNSGSYLSWLDASTILAGGAGGTVGAGQNGGNGLNATSTPMHGLQCFGTSGGGGASNAIGAAGKGGNGGFPGGSGGGGGASLAANASGAGGNGANGQVIIIEYL